MDQFRIQMQWFVEQQVSFPSTCARWGNLTTGLVVAITFDDGYSASTTACCRYSHRWVCPQSVPEHRLDCESARAASVSNLSW